MQHEPNITAAAVATELQNAAVRRNDSNKPDHPMSDTWYVRYRISIYSNAMQTIITFMHAATLSLQETFLPQRQPSTQR